MSKEIVPEHCGACGEGGKGLVECADGRVVLNVCGKEECWERALFQQPPPREDCPICCVRLPLKDHQQSFEPCCGKLICLGCSHALRKQNGGVARCPFCRSLHHSTVARCVALLKRRVKANDVQAYDALGYQYEHGKGVPQSSTKAMELWVQGAELGAIGCHYSLGKAYQLGYVEVDMDKAEHHYQIAAMGGHIGARFKLGALEMNSGRMDREMKHWMLSAKEGHDVAMANVRVGYGGGHVTKDELLATMRAHKDARDEMENAMRDEAEAFRGWEEYALSTEGTIPHVDRMEESGLPEAFRRWKRAAPFTQCKCFDCFVEQDEKAKEFITSSQSRWV